MLVKIDQFSGIAPKVNDPLLSGNMATIAQNLRVDRGCITPLQGTTWVASISGAARSIFKYASSWLYWAAADVDVLRSPVPNDAWARFYYTGSGAGYPQYSFNGRPSSGNPNGYRLGVPKPTASITASKTGTASGTPYDRYYLYTYVTPQGKEGPPSSPVLVSQITQAESVNIVFGTESMGAYNLGTGSFRRIYRTATGVSNTSFEFVADVSIGTLSYTDSKLDEQLGEILPSTNWFPPVDGLTGIKASPNGFFVGFYGNTLFPSERFLPHAWNPSSALAFQGDITALAVTGDSIVVFTTEYPYLVTGSDPDMLTAIKIDQQQTVSNRKSVVSIGGYALAASPDGLISVTANDMSVATQNHLTMKQWQDYSPGTLRGFFFEGIYIGFSATKAFMFDTRQSPAVLVTLSGFSFVAGYNDLGTDTLYLLDTAGNIYAWETGAAQNFIWKSKKLRLNVPICPGAARIYADGAVTFSLWADDTLIFSGSIGNNSAFRLPSGYKGKTFQIQIEGAVKVDSVEIAPTIADLLNG